VELRDKRKRFVLLPKDLTIIPIEKLQNSSLTKSLAFSQTAVLIRKKKNQTK